MDSELKQFEKSLDASVAKLKDELSGVRAGRATPKLIEDVKVDYYGQTMPLKQLGNINVRPPRELEVVIWDKGVVATAVKSLEAANLGLGVSVDGSTVSLSMPALSQERRDELIKLVKKMGEEVRISLRSQRDDVNKKINEAFKSKSISEDQKFSYQKKVDEATKKRSQIIDSALADKAKEIND